MSLYIKKPSPLLTPYVKQYWGLQHCVQKGEEYTQRIIPSGLPELLLYLDTVPNTFSSNRVFEDSALLSGQQNNYYDIHISHTISVFSILFQPQGVSQFFSIPMNEICNNSVPIRYINKKLYFELSTKVSSTNTFEMNVAIAEACLIQLLHTNKKAYEFKRISHIIDCIRCSKGNIDITELVSESCLSRKQFERTFLEYIGISPKQYLKIIRLQASIFSKSLEKNVSLTDLAYKHGYYDQSHFIHEYKALTGLTPKQFYSNCDVPFSDFFE